MDSPNIPAAKNDEWETDCENMGNDAPICPHCSAQVFDVADPPKASLNGKEFVTDCPSCGKRVLVETEYSVTYTTYARLGERP